MTDKTTYEARELLAEWLAYFEGHGQSANLRARTVTMLLKLPERPRYIPTLEEVERMATNGEA